MQLEDEDTTEEHMIDQEELARHTNKYLSEGMGKPCPDCHGGSDMAGCGTCGGTGKVNDKSNKLTAIQRYDSLDLRTRRGTERYATKKNKEEHKIIDETVGNSVRLRCSCGRWTWNFTGKADDVYKQDVFKKHLDNINWQGD
jgi:hypothetical protein